MIEGVHSAAVEKPFSGRQQIIWLQAITLGWMTVECSVALLSAYRSRSVALLAFGCDSAVEFMSAAVVLLQFLPAARLSESLATRVAAVLLFALACVIPVISAQALAKHAQAEVSAGGMAITVGALLFMPLLGALKRQKARQSGNRALAADAVQSMTCAYLAAVTLLSLLVNAVFQIQRVDAAAGLLAVPILIVEGRRAWRGEPCGCCS